jgi:glycosyltransferase involved in cell wall biosynthesis
LETIKIAHLTSAHPPLDTRIFYKECRTLAQAGYEVVLIAPHERGEVFEKVRIRVVPKARNRAKRMIRTTWQVFKAAVHERADIYHFHDPELIPMGVLLSLLGKSVLYDAHEDVPKQILSKQWMSPGLRAWVARAVSVVEFVSALAFDGTVAATPAIAKRFPSRKTVSVQNFPPLSTQEWRQQNSYAARPPIIVYAGGISAIRGAREMIRAIKLLPANLNAKLVLAGNFDPEVEADIENLRSSESVEFLGWQSRESVADLFGQARAGLVLFHPVPNHIEAQPNKLFEYMSAGIPVVASDFPLWRDIVAGTGCGLLVDPLDDKAIASAIRWLLENPKKAEVMGMKGMRAVQARFNWNSEGEKLLTLYRTISMRSRSNGRLAIPTEVHKAR